jgi:hypothetical protein
VPGHVPKNGSGEKTPATSACEGNNLPVFGALAGKNRARVFARQQNTGPARLEQLVHVASIAEGEEMVTVLMVGIVALLAFLCVSNVLPRINRQK